MWSYYLFNIGYKILVYLSQGKSSSLNFENNLVEEIKNKEKGSFTNKLKPIRETSDYKYKQQFTPIVDQV